LIHSSNFTTKYHIISHNFQAFREPLEIVGALSLTSTLPVDEELATMALCAPCQERELQPGEEQIIEPRLPCLPLEANANSYKFNRSA